MGMTVEQMNPHSCKTYLLNMKAQKEIVLIDPVIDHVQDYMELLNKRNLKLAMVIDTHTHADHISGAASLKDITGCEYMMHTKAPASCAGFRVSDGFEWKLFNKIPAKIIHTPGHTNDSLSLIFPDADAIFTGDALFLDDGGAGRDDLPGGDPAAHWESLQRIRTLPENLIVYPAHDYRNRKPSSLKHQKQTNPHLKKRTKEAFIHYLEDLKLGPADWMKDVLKANYTCARDPRAAWIPIDTPSCEVKGTLDPGVNEIQVASIPAAVLKEKINSDAVPLLLDVREPHELNTEPGYIEGVVNIPIGDLTQRFSELEEVKEREIVAICYSGGRAYTAAQILTKVGFHRVSVLAGGMLAWKSE